LAVIEAKAWDEALTEGVAQPNSMRETRRPLHLCHQRPRDLWHRHGDGKEGEWPHYPSPDELWARTFAKQDAWRDRFAAVPFEDKGGSHPGRYYQDIAVERVMEAIAAGKKRILLTLATGTGKTFIAFQIAWKLFHSRWNLSRDAVPPSAHPVPGRPEHPRQSGLQRLLRVSRGCAGPDRAGRHRKKGKVPKNGSLFFTIFQTFMSGPPKDGQPSPYFRRVPAGLLRLHRDRRVPSRRGERRKQLARTFSTTSRPRCSSA
jgi:type I restriction enzyme R subunit